MRHRILAAPGAVGARGLVVSPLLESALSGHALGPFGLEKKVGTGANGDVWFGRHTTSRLPVAIKVLKPELMMNERALLSFRNEVRAVAQLEHPNIVTVYEHGVVPLQLELDTGGEVASGSPFLIMEWASGGTLDDLPKPDTWPKLRATLLTLLDALAHAHAGGVVHRDLKPANILFCTDADLRPGLKLADFGLAVHAEPEKDIRRLLGTPHYMAPEQWRSSVRDQGPWTDLYALGCLVFRILTGRGPYSASTIKQMRQAHLTKSVPKLFPPFPTPDGAQGWVETMMAKDRRDRFQRAADAAVALRALDGVGPEPPPRKRSYDGRSSMVGAGLGLYGLRTVPLVDRGRQRAALWESLTRTRNQGVQVVVLSGPAGTGKSRLCEWLGRRAHEHGEATVVKAAHGSDSGPQDGLGPMLARTMKCLGLEDQPEQLRDRIVEFLRLFGAADPYEIDALTSLVSRGPLARTVRFSSPKQRRGVVLRVLERLTRERPVVCWLDDVQWGVPALGLVEQLLDEQAQYPVLCLLTVQDEALDSTPRARAALEQLAKRFPDRVLDLRVPPLDTDDREELVRGLLGMEGPLIDEVAERSGGNPLFAVQLVADWVQRDLLEVGDSGFRIREGELIELPEDLQRMWAQRLISAVAFRPVDDTRALEMAAVLGQEISPVEWNAACERAWAIPTPDLVDTLIRLRLARCGENGPEHGWSFVHAMLRNHLLDGARSSGRWKVHNRTCAEMLTERGGDPIRIARHLYAAGRHSGALSHLQSAIDAALVGHDVESAGALLSEHEAILQELGVPAEDWRRVDASLLRAEHCRLEGDTDAAQHHAKESEALAQTLGLDRRLAHAMALSARLALAEDDLDGAAGRLDEAELLARGAGDTRLLALILESRGELAAQRGDTTRAVQAYIEATDRAELVNDFVIAGRSDMAHAQVVWRSGDKPAAATLFRRAVRHFEKAGDLAGSATANADLGALSLQLGRTTDALRFFRASSQLFRASGLEDPRREQVAQALVELGR